MIISEFYTKIGQYTGYSSTNADEKAKMLTAINDVLRDFYNEYNLRSSLYDVTFTTTSGTYYYYLDAMANKIVNMREVSSQNNFDCYSREEFEKLYPYPQVNAIATHSLNDGGTGYAADDTFTIDDGTVSAKGTVLTVSSGVVLTYSLSYAGIGYAATTGETTTATSGSGTGLKINILTVSTDNGQPTMYVPLRKCWVAAQPTSASVINIKSSSAADTSKVVVKGWASGSFVVEEVTLSGETTTGANTANSYTEVLSISKAATTGTITATSNSAGVTVVSLLPWQTEKEYIKVRIHPIPNDTYSIIYTFYPKVYDLQYDNELIPLPDKFVGVFEDSVIELLFLQQGSNLADKWTKLVTTGKKELQEMDYQSEEETPDFNFEELMR